MTDHLIAGTFYGKRAERFAADGVTLTVVRHDAGCALPEHAHEHAFLSLLVRGGYEESSSERTVGYAPFTMALHPPGYRHTDRVAPATEIFAIELGTPWLDVIPRLGSLRPELAGGDLVWIAARLRARLRDQTLTPLDVGAAVAEIVATLTRTTSTHETATAPPWLARAREIIAASCETQLTIGDLARELDLHPVYLSRAFRARTGLGIGELAHRLRVQRAAAMLLDPRSALADVALRCGFADQSHFTRVFRSITGTTPRTFRAQLQ